MDRQTQEPRVRRRTRSGLPVHGALPPQSPRVRRKRHAGAWLLLTILLLGIVGGTVVLRLQRSSYFIVNRVDVVGTTNIDLARIVQISAAEGRPIYRVDTSGVERQVAALPMVASVRAEKIWPRSLRLTIVERQPWGTWQISGVNYLVDRSGVVLDLVHDPGGLAIYDLDAASALQPGDHVDADAIGMAAQIAAELPGVLSQQVSKLEYSSEGGLEVVTDRGVRARLGDSQGLDYKLAVWQAVDRKAGSKNVHLIDLRFGDGDYYR
ncbi:MAG: cell division protein FtsQ/DivIB [Dehalococcoidia bacterium]